MKVRPWPFLLYVILCLLSVGSRGNAQTTVKPNVLLICVDDLRPELGSFGAEHISSPHIDALAGRGVSFQRHFVNAPSCGPSRYTLLTGRYGPAGNNALFMRAADTANVPPSMPEYFRSSGYTTVSVGKVSHHPGGRGGPDWNDSTIVEMPEAWDRHLMPAAKWKHPRGAMHGLAHGEIRSDAGGMDVFQAAEGEDDIYPDGVITEEALHQLGLLTAADQPFFLAIGLIKPHLPFGAPQAYLDRYAGVEFPPIAHPEKPAGRTTWHGSGEFMKYNRWGKNPNEDADFAEEVRRHYAACVSYADAQVGKILAGLQRSGADKNTIVVLWGDHGWHLGEHGVWGKHSLFEESLHSPLIVHYPGMKRAGARADAIVETLDIFPTLCELSGIGVPEFTEGISLRGILEQPEASGHPAVAYTNKAKTIRTDTHRLTLHDDGFVELYDHTTAGKETVNVAEENPEVVESLRLELRKRLQ
ncbi:iduronate 2-sulfatase [Lewinella aquimaris]|uniref:Iduronate 2-sulfatase n=1 Tax=Neolewinella aquimaris TaxID=1835722 RepID=A0A840E3M2_9BACT|nr:sulfatase [Neolewinella aquimaris]MBB4079680.1 iduronate 2-sulfatase [Neolewinella aquimaris]